MNKGIWVIIILGIIIVILVVMLVVFSMEEVNKGEENTEIESPSNSSLELSSDVSVTVSIPESTPIETTIDKSLWNADFFNEADMSDHDVQAAFGLWCQANPKACEREYGNSL